MNKILIDSSVWIEYFKSTKKYNDIDSLIDENIICTNNLILAELIPFLHVKKQKELIESINAIDKLPIEIDWDIIVKLQIENIKNGINNVGIPDLIILQNIIDHDVTLYTIDKHFKLMKEIFDIELYLKKE